MLRIAFNAALGLCLATAATTADAGKKRAPQKPKYVPGTSCLVTQAENRVRADMISDLATGAVLYSNMSDHDRATKAVRPASLTKIESAKEAARRIEAGTWKSDQVFAVSFGQGQKPIKVKLREIVQTALNPSLNGIQGLADEGFMSSVNAHMHSIGMRHTTYLNATGFPTSQKVRDEHLTTADDLMISVRDFEMNYVAPEKTKKIFGVEAITGIWKLAVSGLSGYRDRHTLSLIEDEEGKNKSAYPGVRSGKTGYTCDAGFSAYLRYDGYEQQGYKFIVLSLGHDSAAARDAHLRKLIDENKASMEKHISRGIVEITPPPVMPALERLQVVGLPVKAAAVQVTASSPDPH